MASMFSTGRRVFFRKRKLLPGINIILVKALFSFFILPAEVIFQSLINYLLPMWTSAPPVSFYAVLT